MMKIHYKCLMMVTFVLVEALSADTIYLKNGRRIKNVRVEANGLNYYYHTSYSHGATLDANQVESVVSIPVSWWDPKIPAMDTRMLSFFIPGSGQIAVKEYRVGSFLMSGFFASLAGFVAQRNERNRVFKESSNPGYAIAVSLVASRQAAVNPGETTRLYLTGVALNNLRRKEFYSRARVSANRANMYFNVAGLIYFMNLADVFAWPKKIKKQLAYTGNITSNIYANHDSFGIVWTLRL